MEVLQKINPDIKDLKEQDLKKAQGIAGVFTQLRKFLYLFFSIGTAIAFIVMVLQFADAWVSYIIIILMIPYILFKLRDFFRGSI